MELKKAEKFCLGSDSYDSENTLSIRKGDSGEDVERDEKYSARVAVLVVEGVGRNGAKRCSCCQEKPV